MMDGEIVDMYIPSESGHQKAKEKTENLLLYGKRPKNGIILADGMEYASFVESKGTMCFPVVQYMLRRKHKRNSVNNK